MNNQDEIMRKQNDERMIKCQFAARIFFNRAEIQCYLFRFLPIANIALVFVPENTGLVISILPLFIDVLVLILGHHIRKNVLSGAQMRNFFDAKVLGIRDSDFSLTEERQLLEKANSLIEKKKDKFKEQKENTGKDTPPGLKDWYVFPEEYSSATEAVFECQKQNFYWSDKLYQKRIHISHLIAIVVFIIGCIGLHFSILNTLCCILGIGISLYDDIHNNLRCSQTMYAIKILTDLCEAECNSYAIEKLQDLIKQRREIHILESNRIHRRNAAKWSYLYEVTAKDCDSYDVMVKRSSDPRQHL